MVYWYIALFYDLSYNAHILQTECASHLNSLPPLSEVEKRIYTPPTEPPSIHPAHKIPPSLNQRLPPKHPLPNLPHHILPIPPPYQHNPPPPPAHPARPPQPMNEINSRMRDIVQNDMSNRHGVDTPGAQIRRHEHLGIGQVSFGCRGWRAVRGDVVGLRE